MEQAINEFYNQVKRTCGDEVAEHVQIEIDKRNVVKLTGEVHTWQDVVDIGHIAGRLSGTKGVVNSIKTPEFQKMPNDYPAAEKTGREKGIIGKYDIVIIGGGITGASIARTLSKYNKSIVVLEKKNDVCEGASKANNGMIHSGYDSKTGSLKQRMCVKGNAMYTQWSKELDFKFNRCGSFVVAFDEEDEEYLNQFYERGKANGVPGIEILDGDEARKIEPLISPEVTKALWTPSAGYIETYEVVLALMENAIDNGVKLMTETEVAAIDTESQKATQVITNKGVIQAGCVINAAGIYADDIAEMVDDRFYTLHNRRGTLVLMDRKKRSFSPKCFVGTAPKNFTKGGGPMTTPDGNPFWGPSAIEVANKEDVGVSPQDIQFVMEKGKHLSPGINEKDIIRFFSGARPANYIEDFIIEPSEKIDNFIHVAGIQSPGVASAPAVGEYTEQIYLNLFPNTKRKENWNPIRKKQKPFRECTQEERDQLIKEDPKYGHIICRCETVTEAEIIRAIHGKVPATTVDAVKRRTRAGMGRCQAGFCGPRVVEILARELGVDSLEITKNGGDSRILVSKSRKEPEK
ncbi:MAG: FAD/NAD(P)-binding oxidoreductase [Eubacteriaceae bacterium]|uniref:FAD/NAD(P)-binding oxidoreductase n=1 Tax=Candidatus Pseudoramibacter fermentans TaxID=2594427 RepID=A0A6L5GQ65_9FIRM|nr:FAD/NAD(P)-binding oxidoreductase [Candidatus Pseudoramibacter fermentans]RRF92038.1 MAG: FAD/NAD(P)-binding oxidoreductase [Eubacteriaceae bacterium]